MIATLASTELPKYARSRKGSLEDAYEPEIREVLAAYQTMPATVLPARIGLRHSRAFLKYRVRAICPE